MSTLWDETAEKFHKVTDKIGRPIDDGIFDIVVALNMLGVPTKMSCEGHLDHGLPYPWIDVSLPPPKFPIEIRIYGKASFIEVIPDMSKFTDLLFEFYRDRSVTPDRRITLVCGRIHSRGGGDARKLSEYQQEMADFTAFLKGMIPVV
jgi:hypothetical protein